VRVGAILSPESRRKLALLAPHAPWRILGLDGVSELPAHAAAEVLLVRRQVQHCALTLAPGAAKPRAATAEVARDAGNPDRLAAPFSAAPVLELEALSVRLYAEFYRLGARLEEDPVPT
jgi:hypothetical protein